MTDIDEKHPDRKWVNDAMWKLYRLENGKVARTTVWCWMKSLGMKYKKQQQSYYVDNHEDEGNRRYRRGYLMRSLK